MSGSFCRYDLRTTDVASAESFYSKVVGLDFRASSTPDERLPLAIWPLHEQARARGAPAHWLGHIAVADLEPTVSRMVAQGSTRFGPTVRGSDDIPFAILRDPFGAIVAVREKGERTERPPAVGWHQLHTTDMGRAWSLYSDLFGWSMTGQVDAVDPPGGYRFFTWDGAYGEMGGMANVCSGVHPHWLFCFPVDDLEAALMNARALGGTALPPVTLPNGNRLAPCEDAQGAAFGLLQIVR